MPELHAELGSIPERVIRDVETNASEARNALDKSLVGYFVPIDQWRAIRCLLRSTRPNPTGATARPATPTEDPDA